MYQIIQWTVNKCTQFIFPSITNIYPSIDLMKKCLMKALVSLQTCMNFNYWMNYSFNVWSLWSLRLPGGFTPQIWIAQISIRRGTITRGPYRCPCTGTCTQSHPPSDSLSVPAFLWGVTWDLFRRLYIDLLSDLSGCFVQIVKVNSAVHTLPPCVWHIIYITLSYQMSNQQGVCM